MECLSEPRPHLHPLHEAAVAALARPHGHYHPVGSQSAGLTRRQRVRLAVAIGRFVLEHQEHARRALGLARLDWWLDVLDGREPAGFEPRGEVPPVVEHVLRLVGQEHGPGLDDALLHLVRWAAGRVPDGPAYLGFLAVELLRGELASLGQPFDERFVGSSPIFRATRLWLHRARHGGLLLLRVEERQVIVVDGADEHVLASIPDEHFAAVLALVRP